MPILYLSPSTQEYNIYTNDNESEEYYMNLIADAMVPYLDASGIEYVRNTKEMTAGSSITASNAGNYDLHLALHSNAAAGANAGLIRGVEVYYYPNSEKSQEAASVIADNIAIIYPLPDRIRLVPTTTLGEVARTRAPAVLVEFAFHDNPDDANWIRNNIDIIARYMVMALAQYFDVPFNMPQPLRYGRVNTPGGGSVNIRSDPNTASPVLGTVPNGGTVTIYAEVPDWYVVGYGDITGYISKDYITV